MLTPEEFNPQYFGDWKIKTERNNKYLNFIRGHDCIDCGWPHELGRIEAHHIYTGGMGIKCSDYDTVPLCGSGARGCHKNADKTPGKVARYQVFLPKFRKEWGELCQE